MLQKFKGKWQGQVKQTNNQRNQLTKQPKLFMITLVTITSEKRKLFTNFKNLPFYKKLYVTTFRKFLYMKKRYPEFLNSAVSL